MIFRTHFRSLLSRKKTHTTYAHAHARTHIQDILF